MPKCPYEKETLGGLKQDKADVNLRDLVSAVASQPVVYLSAYASITAKQKTPGAPTEYDKIILPMPGSIIT
jgi:hypothetical protein